MGISQSGLLKKSPVTLPSIDITMWQIIYGLFTISHPKTLYPLLQFRNRRSAIQQFSLFNNRTVRNTAFQIVNGFSESASSGSCKQNNGLAGKIIAFQKCIDDRRRNVPPYCVSKLIQSTSCGHRFSIYESTTRYVLFHSSPRTHMILGIVF